MPVAGAVYSAAEQGRLRAAIVVSALVLVLSTLYRLTEEPAFRLLGFEGAQNLVLLVAVDRPRRQRPVPGRPAAAVARAGRAGAA